jgi:hypothetical protein
MRCARIWRWRARNVWRSSPAIIWPKPSARWEMSCLCARINSDHRAYVVEAHEAAVAHPSPRSLRAKASSNGPLSRSLATKTISKLHLAAGFLRRPFLRGLRKPPSHEAAKKLGRPNCLPTKPRKSRRPQDRLPTKAPNSQTSDPAFAGRLEVYPRGHAWSRLLADDGPHAPQGPVTRNDQKR